MKINELIQMLQNNVHGTAMMSVETETEPTNIRKTGNPFAGNIIKKQTLNGCIGFDYEANVNRLAEKEGKEERDSKPRAWGTLTSDRIFVCRGNDGIPTHLRVRVMKSIDPRYVRKDNGEEISKDILTPFIPVAKVSSTQEDLDGQVIERDITLSNVKVLHYKGETIQIEE